MCYAAQQVLHDRDREMRGVVTCPVAMTSKQERESQGRNTTYWCKSGQDLWKLKTQQPHLFARQVQNSYAPAPRNSGCPPGFEETGAPGWLYSPERQVYMDLVTQRLLWFDRGAGVHREVAHGCDLCGLLCISGGAATAGASSTPGGQARHVVIMDLHKAAEAFKIDLSHFDRPAAMIAVYGSAAGAVPAEVAARALHEKLLKRLGSFLSRWSDEALQAAVVESFSAVVADPSSEKGAAAAVALVLGARLLVVAARGAECCVAKHGMQTPVVTHSVTSTGAEINAACIRLEGSGTECVFLLTEAIQKSVMSVAVAQAVKGRPRAGAIALLQESQHNSPQLARASACARLAWVATASGEARTAKRQKVDGGAPETKVRCRQILLKYVGCKQAVDPVRRRPVRRTLAQAESALLGVLKEIDASGDAAFTKQCRAVSECSSSMKGGDLVGDVGWLARPVEKPGERPSREVASRQAVVRAAFDLEIGEISDVLVSDDGVHLLQRRA